MTDLSGDLGHIGPGGVQGPGPIGPIEEIPTEEIEDTGTSTIAKSGKVAEEKAPDASIPALALPWFMPTSFSELFSSKEMSQTNQIEESRKGININQVIEEHRAETISSMLDAWIASIEEVAEQRREELNSPAYQAFIERQSPAYLAKMERETPQNLMLQIRSSQEFLAYVNSLPPQTRADELALNRQESLRAGFINSVNNYLSRADTDSRAHEALPFMAASFVIAAGMMGHVTEVVNTGVTEVAEINPLQQAWGHFAPIIPPELQDAALLTINLFAVGIMYEATGNAIGGASQQSDAPKTLAFAREYARSTLKQVLSGEIKQSLIAMMATKLENGEPISHERIAQLELMAKLMLLAMSLGLIYKVQTDWITADEFAAIIKGEIELPEDETEAAVLQTFRDLLQQASQEERARLLEALMEYFDSNPSVEELTDPIKAFKKVLAVIPNEMGEA